jgi:hypothetical protein
MRIKTKIKTEDREKSFGGGKESEKWIPHVVTRDS